MKVTAKSKKALIGELTELRRRLARLEAEKVQSAPELTQINDMWEMLIHSLADEVWICDAEGKLSLVNHAVVDGPFFNIENEVHKPLWKALFGLEIQDGTGRLRSEEDTPLIRSLKGEILKNVEEVVRNPKTGEMTYRQVSSAPIRNRSDQIIGAIAVVRDITPIRETEDALRKSELLLKQTQSCTKAGGWELNLDSGQAQITEEVYRIYGVKKGYFDQGGIKTAMSLYAPESRPVLEKAFENAIKRGEPYDLDLEFIRADGERIWVRTIGTPEVKDGKVVRLYGNFVDITDRKRVEAEHLRAKTLLETVYASLEEAVFVVEPATRTIISCNDAASRMFGYAAETMVGRTTRFLHVNKKMFDSFGSMIVPALDANGIFRIEYNLRKKDGTVFPTEHRVKAIKDHSGSRILYISVVRDLTNRKEVAGKLHQKEEEVELKNKRLEEMNTALGVLLKYRDDEQKSLVENFFNSINSLIVPYLDKIKRAQHVALRQEYINILEANLKEILKPHAHRISMKLTRLSPSETRIVHYIQQGYRIKEIAALLKVSPRTIEYHRGNIRKKLGVKNRKVNLKTYLSSLF